ncbi:MAG: hypothetical protein BWX70_01745 [Verrucomicrobia bacterium ADurb.Bin070]|nr:MAG: hypothetical protein BWX70_01745 [Verrucomicrobia bacterium ADurb.Bin070]
MLRPDEVIQGLEQDAGRVLHLLQRAADLTDLLPQRLRGRFVRRHRTLFKVVTQHLQHAACATPAATAQAAQQLGKACLGQLRGKVARCRLLQIVRLVKDDLGMGRQGGAR